MTVLEGSRYLGMKVLFDFFFQKRACSHSTACFPSCPVSSTFLFSDSWGAYARQAWRRGGLKALPLRPKGDSPPRTRPPGGSKSPSGNRPMVFSYMGRTLFHVVLVFSFVWSSDLPDIFEFLKKKCGLLPGYYIGYSRVTMTLMGHLNIIIYVGTIWPFCLS